MDAVSQVLAGRQTADGVTPMVWLSVAGHLLLAAAIVLVPAAWMGIRPQPDEPVMMVTLGGAPGPQTGGRQVESAQSTQAVAAPAPRLQPVLPPTVATPEMIVPTKAPPKKTPPAPVKQAPREATARLTPSTGAEIQKGDANANTTSRNQTPFGGLSSGGGGSGPRLDVQNFCCPEYLVTMQDRILRNWESRQQSLGVTGVVFVVQRDGTLSDVAVEKSSGNSQLDFLATRALLLTRQLPALPGEYPNQSLRVHLTFEYQR
ncbi:MAG: TonB family protein [Acidobacteriota bacterium]